MPSRLPAQVRPATTVYRHIEVESPSNGHRSHSALTPRRSWGISMEMANAVIGPETCQDCTDSTLNKYEFAAVAIDTPVKIKK